MIKKPNCKYMFLDGMPVVEDSDGVTWVFARTTKNWMKVPADDLWNVVYPNFKDYWELFKDLPELPTPASS
jgi:hypothetical protein